MIKLIKKYSGDGKIYKSQVAKRKDAVKCTLNKIVTPPAETHTKATIEKINAALQEKTTTEHSGDRRIIGRAVVRKSYTHSSDRGRE